MAAYLQVTHHGYRYGYTLGPKMATHYSYLYPHHRYGLLMGTAKNTRGLPVQITTSWYLWFEAIAHSPEPRNSVNERSTALLTSNDVWLSQRVTTIGGISVTSLSMHCMYWKELTSMSTAHYQSLHSMRITLRACMKDGEETWRKLWLFGTLTQMTKQSHNQPLYMYKILTSYIHKCKN